MLCTFCGTDNRRENKFCGMCGVRLERRKVERRFHHNSFSPKCPSCGHVNEPGYKFCAMCGDRVDRRLDHRRGSVAEQPRANAIANVQLPTPDVPAGLVEDDTPAETTRVMEASAHAEPALRSVSTPSSATISGPSFLGLSDESGEGADYLLEDQGSGGVLRRLVFLAVLVGAGGLAFVQWRSGFPLVHAGQRWMEHSGFPLLHDGQRWLEKAINTLPLSRREKSGTSAATTGDPKDPGEEKSVSSTAVGDAEGRKDAAEANRTAASPTTAAKAMRDKVPDLAPPGKVVDTSSTTPDTPAAAAKNAIAMPKASPGVKAKRLKNQAESPSGLLLRAQEYISGTGGHTQNCDQGLVYLRAAAKSEAAAAMQMGSLYATGHCVPQDRVQGYRWLNSARELQPANPEIQSRMNELWAQMTVRERRQIVR